MRRREVEKESEKGWGIEGRDEEGRDGEGWKERVSGLEGARREGLGAERELEECECGGKYQRCCISKHAVYYG